MARADAAVTATPGSLQPAGGRPPGGRSTGGHLYQVDIVRLGAFLAVIAVHAIAFTQLPSNQPAAGAMMLLQFGREVFFALTGFVLYYSTARRPLRLGSFWRRRLSLVAVPYATWTVIYDIVDSHGAWSWSHLGWTLLDGGAKYHLYFLLVTLQLYLIFPLLRPLVAKTASRPYAVLLPVGALNLAWLAVVQYGTAPAGAGGVLWSRAYELLPTYTLYVLAGCYAAARLGEIQAWVHNRSRALLVVAAASAAIAELVYAVQLQWMAPRAANAVLQPAMALTSLAAGLGLYILGTRWSEGRRRGAGLVAEGSDISFGIYLSHPLFLQFLLDHGLGNGRQALPSPLATVIAIVGALGGGILLSLAARRTPLSLLLTGRPWSRRAAPMALGRQRPSDSASVGA